MRKYIVACTISYMVFSAYVIANVFWGSTYINVSDISDIRLASMAEGDKVMVGRYGSWTEMYIRGVDMGLGIPGKFPGDFAISKSQYLRWFKEIAGMNANTIRVYTIQSPDFYEALYDYNNSHLDQLYLIQGVWVDEEAMLATMDAYSPELMAEFKMDAIAAADAVHGHLTLEESRSKGSGVYKKDVSKWVIGYILGIEWDGSFIRNTNERHRQISGFSGPYLKAVDASPFEAFLAEVGDYLISYETRAYNQQRMIAFSNWPVTDPLQHSGQEASVNVGQLDVEHIKAAANFYAGQFASYHVYPYYPDFLHFQPEYQLPGPDGKVDTYRAYLAELKSHHTMPVVISEYGIPSSRGIARIEPVNGYDQGNVSEREQGELLVRLTEIIHDEGFAGGIVFSWQDEWFKRTWNTMDFSLPDARAYWSDYQTNEQSFGLLAFDPGRKESAASVDGNISEWREKDLLAKNGDTALYARHDEKFLYLRISKPGLNFGSDVFLLPIDITEKSGIKNSARFDAEFERPADFLLRIGGKSDSRLTVHDYYDVFVYRFSEILFGLDPESYGYTRNAGDFNDSYLAIRAPLPTGRPGEFSEPLYFETGLLKHGNTDPDSPDYDSLADFYHSGNEIEIRIPWALLNIMDPSSMQGMDDFYAKGSIVPQKLDHLFIGVGEEGSGGKIAMTSFTWEKWDEPDWHERLKPSYEAMKAEFGRLRKGGD